MVPIKVNVDVVNTVAYEYMYIDKNNVRAHTHTNMARYQINSKFIK